VADGVVIDTSAFYALASPEDRFHNAAHEAYWMLVATERALSSTSYVLVETQALIVRRLGFEAARMLMTWSAGIVEIVWVGRELHQEAWEHLEERRGIGLSLVDWTVLLTAQRESAAVFTFDGDFRHEGIPVIPAAL
jgi:uncharacterized protein